MSATPLAGKVALVTGSSRSIGAAIAERLAADGANVIINYVNGAAAAEEVAKRINSKGVGRAEIVQADVSTVVATKALVEKTMKLFNRLDILVLNAGVLDRKTLSEVTEEHYDQHFNVNVKGPVFLTQAAAPHIQTGGRVIFFSSSLTISSTITPEYLVYIATKGAVEQLTRVLSKDLGQRQITVNTVSPGPTATPLFKEGMNEQRTQFLSNLSPMKRLGESEDIASVVAFLARDDSQWVSGQNIRVNGAFAV